MICTSTSKKEMFRTIVLDVLSERRMYGYEITQAIKQLVADSIIITEGALYPTLYVLECEGMLETDIEYISGRRRKYYTLKANRKKEGMAYLEKHTKYNSPFYLIQNPECMI